jgi:hypothetical protein
MKTSIFARILSPQSKQLLCYQNSQSKLTKTVIITDRHTCMKIFIKHCNNCSDLGNVKIKTRRLLNEKEMKSKDCNQNEKTKYKLFPCNCLVEHKQR